MHVYLDRPKSKNWFDFYSIRDKTVTLERILFGWYSIILLFVLLPRNELALWGGYLVSVIVFSVLCVWRFFLL
jgi:hypothetical protein